MTELWPTVATTISINSYGGGGHTTGDGGNTSLGGSVNVIWNKTDEVIMTSKARSKYDGQ